MNEANYPGNVIISSYGEIKRRREKEEGGGRERIKWAELKRQRISKEFHPSSISFPTTFPRYFFSFTFTNLWIVLYAASIKDKVQTFAATFF